MVVRVAVMEDDQLSTAEDVDPASAGAAAVRGGEPSISGDGLDPFLDVSTVTEPLDIPVPGCTVVNLTGCVFEAALGVRCFWDDFW